MPSVADELKRVPLFEDLSNRQLKRLAGDFRERTIVGDADGVVVIPKQRAVEVSNRAMYCLEAENRLRSEIVSGKSTLAKVMDLEKWEKKVLAGESDGMERLPGGDGR